jgi:hypothetical protein
LAPKEGQNPELRHSLPVFPERNESEDYEIHFDCIDNDGSHIDLPSVWRIFRDGSLRLRWLE